MSKKDLEIEKEAFNNNFPADSFNRMQSENMQFCMSHISNGVSNLLLVPGRWQVMLSLSNIPSCVAAMQGSRSRTFWGIAFPTYCIPQRPKEGTLGKAANRTFRS